MKPQAPSPESGDPNAVVADPGGGSPVRDRYYTWAELMQRVFRTDVLECEHCGGRMRILAVIRRPAAIARILEYLGLPSRAPPLAPASCGNDFHPDTFYLNVSRHNAA